MQRQLDPQIRQTRAMDDVQSRQRTGHIYDASVNQAWRLALCGLESLAMSSALALHK